MTSEVIFNALISLGYRCLQPLLKWGKLGWANLNWPLLCAPNTIFSHQNLQTQFCKYFSLGVQGNRCQHWFFWGFFRIFIWVHWVLVTATETSLSYTGLFCCNAWTLQLWCTNSLVVVQVLICSSVCGILVPSLGLNLHPLQGCILNH